MNFRKLYILSAFLLAVAVSACIRLGNDAETVADSIAEAVESKDFNRLAEIDEAFRASLSDDQETRREQRKALAELADDADNDTVRIATLLIAQLPDACGELLVNRLIESRTEGNTKETFLSTLSTVQMLYSHLNSEDFVVFNQAYQKGIDRLSIDEQMKIYCAIASPEMIGEVMADDVIRSAETPQQQEVFTTVNQRISSLKSSYKPTEFERMKNAFGRTLLSAGGDQWLTAFEF